MRSLFKALLASAALSALVLLALSLPSARRSPAASRASDASPVAVAGAQPTGTGPGAGPVPAQATPGDPTAPDVATVPQTAAAPSTRSRAWDPGYLASLRRVSRGEVIRFELVGGEFASGTVRHTEFHDGELLYLAGELTAPEAGRFFFQKQTLPGKAGEFAGVVEFPASRKAYRIEPSGPNGASELVERSLGDVVCLGLPPRTDAVTEEIPPLDPSDHPDYAVPDYQDGIISLQSLPGATAVLYIDYRGGYTPTWGGITYERPNVSNAEIKDVWKRVA